MIVDCSEAELSDAGLFECQVSTLPVKSYFVRLNVVGNFIFPFLNIKKTRTKSCPKERKLGLKEIMRRNYTRKLWGEIITGNYEEKLSQELWGEIITGNYEEKLSKENMRRNYHMKLSASIYHHAKNEEL